MKRHILIVTTLLIAISLVGCTRGDPQETGIVFEPTASSATSAPNNTEVSAETSAPTTAESSAPAEDTESTVPNETEDHNDSTAETEHKHSYKSKVTKQPTCSATGIRTFTCSECGASYTENIKALDHAFVITKVAPDCTNTGGTTYHCKDCGYTYTAEIKDPLGHDYGPLVTIKNPTEQLPGVAEHTCSRCGRTERVELPKLTPAS